MKCVIDTNVLMAALLNRTGAPAKIIERFRNVEFELTKNIRHYPAKEYQGIKIATVGQFLAHLEKEKSG